MRLGWLTSLLLLAAAVPCAAADPAPTEQQFSGQIAPLLEQHCVKCHQGDKPKGGLSLLTH